MIVVKIGGSVICKDPSRAVADLARYAGEAIAIHGGGCAVNELLRSLGIQPKYLTHPGGVTSRYTDAETLKAFVMAMSWINKSLVASLAARGVVAVGLTGADGWVVKAKRKERVLVVDERGRQRVVDGGYSGRIVDVDVKALSPPPLKVLAPIALSDKGELLNVDGDQIAFEVASRLRAKLVILSDVDGVMIGGRVVERLGPEEAEALAKSEEVKGGMKRKLLAAAEAAKNGVETAIYNGLVDSPIEKALSGLGTHIIPK
ncbi:MAG: [LysW]-aminoadipate/[LysW]-glutamate kinase [Thermoproteus sp. AZ2]|jgi:acetylglutamate/LysW-gamma-L-alpha-aminoadipate kinase|uniref:[LysW]-aminoadipate/[LysW]-glutamate kinase n=1 Tax=Thermoproteus sp. AZ2 TaxID=1609232 RepID=A0ACC6V0I7_9CREN|nr:MAG: acetylglutamate kinase [Thermoproteus sp. AZ2]